MCLKVLAIQKTPVKHSHISIVKTVVCTVLWLEPFIYCLVSEQAGKQCCFAFRPNEKLQERRITPVIVNVAVVYYRVNVLANLCLVKNWQMNIYRHPPGTGNAGDWTAYCWCQCLCHRAEGRGGSLFCADVPLCVEWQILQFIFKTCFMYIATRGQYIIRLAGREAGVSTAEE